VKRKTNKFAPYKAKKKKQKKKQAREKRRSGECTNGYTYTGKGRKIDGGAIKNKRRSLGGR